MLHRVLLIRSPELCTELFGLLESEGFIAAAIPATTTEYINPEHIDLSVPWIAFTSANGVRGYFEALKQASLNLPFDVMIAAVGEATAKAVRLYFAVEPEVISNSATGADLARELNKTLPAGTEILYPCPNGHESDFTKVAREHGLLVHNLPVYRTVPEDCHLLRAKLNAHLPVEAVVFYAPSAVKAFHAAHPTPWEFAAIAIGPTTHNALRELGHDRIFTAAHPTPSAIAEAVHASLLHSETSHA